MQRPIETDTLARERIRAERERAGLSRTDLAARVAGQGEPYALRRVEHLERGAVSVLASDVLRLALALGVSPLALLSPEPDDFRPVSVGGRVLAPDDARKWIRGRYKRPPDRKGADAP